MSGSLSNQEEGSLNKAMDRLGMDDLELPKAYQRGEGVANEKGTGFEYKMAILLYIRAQRLTNKFRLGVNYMSAGQFDDLVLIYFYKDKKYSLHIQLKHKLNLDKKLAYDAFKSKTGAFAIPKYFKSYQDCVKEHGLYNDTNFVLFTNAFMKIQLHKADNLNPLAEELLNTGGRRGLMYRVKLTDEICDSFKKEDGAEEFINNLVICCQQAGVDELDDLIKQEILLHFRRILPNLDSLYSVLLEDIKTWWEMTGTTDFLTEDRSTWINLAPRCTLLNHIRFRESEIEDLLKKVDHAKVHLMYPGVDVQLRSLKVLHALQEMKNVKFAFVKLDDIVYRDDEGSRKERSILELWRDGIFDVLAVDTYNEKENNDPEKDTNQIEEKMNEDLTKVLETLLKLVDGSRRLLLVSGGNLTVKLGTDWFLVEDSCTLNQLDGISKDLVVQKLWEISPNKSEVLKRDRRGELLSMFLLLDNETMTLQPGKNGNTPLLLAVKEQNLDKVELLLELGSDYKGADRFGDSPLLVACRKSNSEIVKILLEHGAPTDAADFHGDSPLIVALRNMCTDTVRVLLEYKANPDAADKFGNTPLLIAAKMDQREITELLLRHRASTRYMDLEGNSALHLAVKSKDKELVRMLLEYKAHTTTTNVDGDTPLLLAVRDGSEDIVQLLLENKAPTTSVSVEGDSALLIAVKKRFPVIVKMLLDHGASKTVADFEGLSPLNIAERECYEDIVELLRF